MSDPISPTSPRRPPPHADLSPREQKYRDNVAKKTQSAARRTAPISKPSSTASRRVYSPHRRDSSKTSTSEEKTTDKVASATSVHFSRRPRSNSRGFYTSQKPKPTAKRHPRSKSSGRKSQSSLLRTVTPGGAPKVTPVGPPLRFAHLAKIGHTNSDSTLLTEEDSPHTSSSHTPSPHTQLREFSFPQEDLSEFKIDKSNQDLLLRLIQRPNTFICIVGTSDSSSIIKDDSIEVSKERFFIWIEKDATSHQGSIRSYEFFREFLGEKAPKDLKREEVLLLAGQHKLDDIYEFYRKKLEKYPIPSEQLNLFFSKRPSIPECEAFAQAVHNLAALITRIHEEFHDVHPGSVNTIKYFFDLIKNELWLKTVRELNLKGLALTWIPDLLSSLSFTNPLKISLPKNLLSEIPYRFFHQSNVISFDASDNPIRIIAQDFGQTWEKAEEIHVSRTQITSFPFENFQGRLKEGLHIEETSIEEVPEGLTYQVFK